jgi:hypothetical protein
MRAGSIFYKRVTDPPLQLIGIFKAIIVGFCKCLNDVEDWFHILDIGSAVNLEHWDEMENRVVSNALYILDILHSKLI